MSATRVSRALALLAPLALFGGCPDRPAPAPAPPTIATASSPTVAVTSSSVDPVSLARARANAAADALFERLQRELQVAIARGGPATAVRTCNDVAQDLTARLAREQGVELRRTALKLRNPKNAPDDLERAYLERTRDALARGEPAKPFEQVEGGELRLLRPIVYKGGVCDTCHGPRAGIPEGVRKVLSERYPEDAATDFRPGDLRGAFSVRVRLP